MESTNTYNNNKYFLLSIYLGNSVIILQNHNKTYQKITQGAYTESYDRLYHMLKHFLDDKLRRRHQKEMEQRQRNSIQQSAMSASSRESSVDSRSGKKKCRFFLKGTCQKGEDCPFYHDYDKLNAAHPAAGDSTLTQKGKNNKGGKNQDKPQPKAKGKPKRGKSPSGKEDQPVCNFYLRGKCRNGQQCDFFHPRPCKFHQQGTCTAGKDCNFYHIKPPGSGNSSDAEYETPGNGNGGDNA